jgi:hypothetical protein
MTIQQAAQDIRYLIADYFPTNDTRISLGYALNLVNQKRALSITTDYYKRGLINEQWLSNLGIIDVTQIDFSSSLEDQDCDCNIGRFTIPAVVRMDYDKFRQSNVGVYTVRSTCGIDYNPTNERKFKTMWDVGDMRAKLPYYWHEGNYIYIYPFRDELNIKLVLENPLDGKYLDPEHVSNGSLEVGESYAVSEGNISYNTGSGVITIQRGQTFTANATGGLSWAGSGKVKRTTKIRNAKWSDNYPLDGATYSQAKELVKQDLQAGKINLMDAADDNAPEEGLQKAKG